MPITNKQTNNTKHMYMPITNKQRKREVPMPDFQDITVSSCPPFTQLTHL